MTILSIALAVLALSTTVNCQTCPRNCVRCTNNVTCTQCADGFYNGHLYDDKRYSVKNNCSLQCNEQCDTCDSYENCTKCKAGYCNAGNQRRCTNECNHKCRACSSCNICKTCETGYYGISCNISCGYGCLNRTCETPSGICKCDKNFKGNRCDQCITGKYGTRCQYECARGCLHNDCDSNGLCLQGCKKGYTSPYCNACMDGFYGNECETCPENCKTCLSTKHCSVCKGGFSGSTCELTCPQGCTNCDSNRKCSTCVSGFHGLSCSSKCPRNCYTINCNQRDGNCYKCKPGFWGNYCNFTCGPGCSQNVCIKANGECNKCNTGFTGERCENCVKGFFGHRCLPCATNCTDCVSATQCLSCVVGFYGRTCSELCSENCLNGLCSLNNGTCQHCKGGFYGDRCEFSCPSHCIGNSCSLDGECFACKEGFYGDKCETKCSPQCKGSCKQFSGECNYCFDGFFGNYCDENCPKDCVNCTSNMECTLCKRGKKGILCQQDCSNCRTGTQCRKSDGYCIEACAYGFYGQNCDTPCAVRCKTCHRYRQYQCTSCPYGKYGKNTNYGKTLACHLDCRDECLNKSCDEQNGFCLLGCKRGYWGMTCDWACPKNCKNRFCSLERGLCLDGCVEGFFGDKCTYNCSKYDQNCQICGSKANNKYDGCKSCNTGYFPSNELNSLYKRCIPCPLECYENSCSAETGLCLHGCTKGHWGETCKKLCPSRCIRCNQKDGICLNCISGSYGDDCSQNCSPDCAGRCEKNSGKCVIGCASKKRYGSYCDKDCSSNCVNKACNWTTGHCSLACVDGFFGSTCDIFCSKLCRNSSCSRDGGECNIGCIEGYEGPQCAQEASGSGYNDIMPSIVTSVFSIVAVCAFVVVLYIRHHRRDKDKHKEDNGEMQARTGNEDFVDEPEDDKGDVETGNFHIAHLTKEKSDAKDKTFGSHDFVGFSDNVDLETNSGDETTEMGAVSFQENTYDNAATVLRRRIELDKLQEFVSKISKDDFIAEFQELPVGLIKSYEASQRMENRTKNRYRGLYPYDGRRVIIKSGRSDYINASYVDGYRKRNAYIASTGPTVKHMGEDFAIFWEMVWQEHVTKIIMLTNLIELGVSKCDQYWPGEGSCCTYGHVVVSCRTESIQKNFTIRTFDITRQNERRTLCQIHFTSWPDKGIPESVALFTEFHSIANDESISKATDYPILVHCSAGVGRTGTYIALDILTAEGRAEGYVDIFACVRNLREDRVNMVQTREQYVYIHKCLVENLTQNVCSILNN